MLRFLFCAKNLSGFLASQWNVIMDHVYVNENFIAPMLACMPEAQVLLAELKFKVEIGANPDKDRKKSTGTYTISQFRNTSFANMSRFAP